MVYLRYVLDELRYGLRSLTDLDQLPTDLASYYIESLAPFEAEPTWARTRLPLLATSTTPGLHTLHQDLVQQPAQQGVAGLVHRGSAADHQCHTDAGRQAADRIEGNDMTPVDRERAPKPRTSQRTYLGSCGGPLGGRWVSGYRRASMTQTVRLMRNVV